MHGRSLGALAVAAVLLVGCSSTASGPNGSTPGTSLSFATSGGRTATASAMVSASLVASTPSDSITIDSAFVVMRKIELEGPDSTNGCPDEGAPPSGHDCGEIELGPVLVSLPLNDTSVVKTFQVPSLPNGTYTELEFRVHRPSRAKDTTFLAANPGYDSTSVRVVGRYHGTPFVFTSGVSAKYEARLNPPLVVADTSSQNLTIKVDVGTWFKSLDGSSIIDPATAGRGTANGAIVALNIRRSFRSLQDHDRDGRDDHGGDGHCDDHDGN